MAAGRPSEYRFKLCEEICEEIANGGNVVGVLDKNDKYPSWSTFRRWKNDNKELQTLYIKAIQDKSEAIIFEIIEVMSDLKEGKIDASSSNVLIQTLKWMAAKFYPKMYGDSTKVEHSTESGVTKIIIETAIETPPSSD